MVRRHRRPGVDGHDPPRLELGYTLFDTAEAYGPYDNEELLGKALKGRREQAVIATKFGFPMKLKDGTTAEADSRPEHVVEVVEASLRRLGTDHVDVLYQHRVDPRVPIEETVGAMADLVEQGKVRYLGLCEAGAATVRRAHAVHPLSVVQSEFSVWERNLEADVLPVLRELGIGLVGFCPLGRGFLTGGVLRAEDYPEDDFRHHDPRLQGANYDQNTAVAATVRELAEARGLTPAQLAIAWVLHQAPTSCRSPGPSGAPTWRRTPPRPQSASTPRRSPRSTRRSAPTGSPGPVTTSG